MDINKEIYGIAFTADDEYVFIIEHPYLNASGQFQALGIDRTETRYITYWQADPDLPGMFDKYDSVVEVPERQEYVSDAPPKSTAWRSGGELHSH